MFEKEWLERALSFQEYVDKAEMNVPTIKANYEDTQISEEDHKYLSLIHI